MSEEENKGWLSSFVDEEPFEPRFTPVHNPDQQYVKQPDGRMAIYEERGLLGRVWDRVKTHVREGIVEAVDEAGKQVRKASVEYVRGAGQVGQAYARQRGEERGFRLAQSVETRREKKRREASEKAREKEEEDVIDGKFKYKKV